MGDQKTSDDMSKFLTHFKLPAPNKDSNALFPGSPDSNMSDISYPSHLSGLESFVDADETAICSDNDESVSRSKISDKTNNDVDISDHWNTEKIVSLPLILNG